MIDRDQLRESIAEVDRWVQPGEDVEIVVEAARLVADPDTLILHGKDGVAIRTEIEMILNRWCPSLNDYAVSQAAKDILDVLEANALLEGKPT